jgi:hypothetical protein
MSEFQNSGKNYACPVCGRQKPDCKSKEQENVVFCHTHTSDPNQELNGYKFIKPTKDGVWGLFVYDVKDNKGKNKGKKIRAGEVRAQFFYPRRDGSPFIKVEKVAQGAEKSFYQYHWESGGWICKMSPDRADIPIYRYQEVREAIASNKPIVIVEGETSADALWSIGIAATTFIGGASKYKSYGKRYQDDLEGANLFLCPDRDHPGLKHMEEVHKDFPHAKTIKVFPQSPIWLSVPESGGLDIEDWIAEGATTEDIFKSAEAPTAPKDSRRLEKLDFAGKMAKVSAIEDKFGFQTAEYNDALYELSKAIGYQKSVLEGIYFQHLSECLTTEFKKLGEYDRPKEDREWIIADLVPKGSTMLVYADGGVGKTLLLYDMIDSIYREKTFLGHPIVERVRASIIQTDEPENDFKERMAEKGMFDLDVFACIQWSFGALRQLEDHIIRDEIGLVLIDSFASNSRFATTEEKDAAHAAVLYRLRDVAQRQNCTIIVIHHSNKNGTARGSTAIRNNVSEVWNLRKPNKDLADEQKILHNERILDCEKSRSGVTLKYVIGVKESLDWEYIGDLRKIEDRQQNEPATIPEKLKAFFMANSEASVTINQLMTSPLFRDDDRAVIKTSLSRLKKKGYLRNITAPGSDTIWALQNNPSRASEKSCYTVTPDAGTHAEQVFEGVTMGVTSPVTPYKVVTGEEGVTALPVTDHDVVTGEVTGSVTPLNPIGTNGFGLGCNGVTHNMHAREAESFAEINEEGDLLSRRNSSTKKDPDSSRAPMGSYTGPEVGSTVRFVSEVMSAADRAKLRKSGIDYPWGQSGTVIGHSTAGRGYSVTVQYQQQTFVVTNLLAIEKTRDAPTVEAPDGTDYDAF